MIGVSLGSDTMPEQQQGFRDIVDVVKAEASSANPDTGKLQRWGKTLVSFASDVGLKLASSTIAHAFDKKPYDSASCPQPAAVQAATCGIHCGIFQSADITKRNILCQRTVPLRRTTDGAAVAV